MKTDTGTICAKTASASVQTATPMMDTGTGIDTAAAHRKGKTLVGAQRQI
jgi:hypothetical protein